MAESFVEDRHTEGKSMAESFADRDRRTEGKSMAESFVEDVYNPNGCPAASRIQMIGNQCALQGQRTLCCVQTRNGAWHSWVQCSSHMCSGPNNVVRVSSVIAPDSEDFDSEDFDMSTYEDLFEQQQLEQYDDLTNRKINVWGIVH